MFLGNRLQVSSYKISGLEKFNFATVGGFSDESYMISNISAISN